jgi:hypothetical protein
VRQHSSSNSSSSYAALVPSMGSYGPVYNESAWPSSDGYHWQAQRDTTASLPHRLRKQPESSQPFQQQARRIEPLRRRVHSPYSAVRRPINTNCNRDQQLDNQMETVQINKASFRPKRKKALCVSPFELHSRIPICRNFLGRLA